uniref:histone acetyltransferase n=1 Tax=Bursaphelenchus xylophilus TaxID=6326 RepID=A0A1I7SBQ5_BURXY
MIVTVDVDFSVKDVPYQPVTISIVNINIHAVEERELEWCFSKQGHQWKDGIASILQKTGFIKRAMRYGYSTVMMVVNDLFLFDVTLPFLAIVVWDHHKKCPVPRVKGGMIKVFDRRLTEILFALLGYSKVIFLSELINFRRPTLFPAAFPTSPSQIFGWLRTEFSSETFDVHLIKLKSPKPTEPVSLADRILRSHHLLPKSRLAHFRAGAGRELSGRKPQSPVCTRSAPKRPVDTNALVPVVSLCKDQVFCKKKRLVRQVQHQKGGVAARLADTRLCHIRKDSTEDLEAIQAQQSPPGATEHQIFGAQCENRISAQCSRNSEFSKNSTKSSLQSSANHFSPFKTHPFTCATNSWATAISVASRTPNFLSYSSQFRRNSLGSESASSNTSISDCEEDEMAPNVDPIEDLQNYIQNPVDDQRNVGLQKQFASILHANKCMKQKQNNMCTLPICPQWKVVLMHYNQCSNGLHCTFEHCATSRVLLMHFESCQRAECSFCAPLRRPQIQPTNDLPATGRERRETVSSTHSFFVQSPNSSYEQGSYSYEGMSHASQAYFRRWGEWNETRVQTNNTTHYYTTTHMAITNVEDDGNSSQEDQSMEREVCQTERIQRELVVMLHVQKCAAMDMNFRKKIF